MATIAAGGDADAALHTALPVDDGPHVDALRKLLVSNDVFKGCALFHANHDPGRLADNIRKYMRDRKCADGNASKAKSVAARFDYDEVKGQYAAFYRNIGFV